MKLLKYVLFLIFAMGLSSYGQFLQKSQYSGIGVPYFDVEIFRTFTEDGKNNKIVLYSEMLYDDVTFIKRIDNTYDAKVEFVILILTEEEEHVHTRSLIREINEKNYSYTNSREKKMVFNEEFQLPPGDYIIKVQANDLTSNKSINRKVELKLKDITEKSSVLSDILLLENIVTDSTGNLLDIIPQVKNNFPEKLQNFYVYFDLYTKNITDELTIQIKFLTRDEEAEIDSTVIIKPDQIVTHNYIKIKKEQLKRNQYNIILSYDGGQEEDERRKLISFYWETTPQTSEDITLALRQMRYIVPEDSSDKYLEADLESQKEFFNRFWAERDPNPNTTTNELMDEYFGRVNISNKEFSTFTNNGWFTDRGRILIKFGHPDDIERHPFELHTNPYVVWRYYSLRKIFVFMDRTGFGDYQLHPDYFDQEWR